MSGCPPTLSRPYSIYEVELDANRQIHSLQKSHSKCLIIKRKVEKVKF